MNRKDRINEMLYMKDQLRNFAYVLNRLIKEEEKELKNE